MIEVQKNYKITFTEDQARQLYNLLQATREGENLSVGSQYEGLRDLRQQLKEVFNPGIR